MSERSKKTKTRKTAKRLPGSPEPANLAAVVEALSDASDAMAKQLGRRRTNRPLPARDAIIAVVEGLRAVLFPGYFGVSEIGADSLRFHLGSQLDRLGRLLLEQIKRGLCFLCEKEPSGLCRDCETRAKDMAREFLSSLGRVRHLLATDVQAAFEGDPAATSPDEAIFCYPGLRAVTDYRLAHELHRLGVPLIPRFVTEHAHGQTGIDIHPGARIGESFFIDHGTGVVIGETCIIGKRVRLYQGVTLGAKSFPRNERGELIKGIERHPIVEDDVIIYSGATILGRVTIGRGAVIGGNVWLTESVPPGARITQSVAHEIHYQKGGGI